MTKMSVDASTDKLNLKSEKFKPKKIKSCMMTPSYPISVNPNQFGVVSPVLLPYVQAPVCFVKGKSKKIPEKPISKSPVEVRYVPALAYTPVNLPYICYNKNCLAQSNFSHSITHRFGVPFAMRINPKACSINSGYVSALIPPTAYVENKKIGIISKSELNPLSRPYTPPSRLKQCACGQKRESVKENFCQKCQSEESASVSSSESCDYDDSSRGTTPVSSWSKKFSNTDGSLSDTDSGVDGECDDEIEEEEEDVEEGEEWVDCKPFLNDEASNYQSDDELVEAVAGLDLRCVENVGENLPADLSTLVEFLCLHLDSYEWRTVARELGVNDVFIQSLDYDFFDSFREQMQFVFKIWARSQQSKTNSDNKLRVEKALFEIGRQDLVLLLNEKLNDD